MCPIVEFGSDLSHRIALFQHHTTGISMSYVVLYNSVPFHDAGVGGCSRKGYSNVVADVDLSTLQNEKSKKMS